MIRFLAFFLTSVALAAPGARVLVLDDFESPSSTARWTGLKQSSEHFAHGRSSGAMQLGGRRTEAVTTALTSDWRAYDSLRFDIFSDRREFTTVSLRIYDDHAAAGQETKNDYYEANRKILVLKGWNHVEVHLPLRAASNDRDLSLEHIRRFVVMAERSAQPRTLYLDNFRLVAGEEPAANASATRPEDAVTTLDGRFFTIRQVARPEGVPESAAVTALRAEAGHEADLLQKTIDAARLQGIDTIYQERHLITAELGLRVRPRLAWFNNDEAKHEMFAYVAQSCGTARQELEDKIQGIDRLPEIDDTRVGGPLVPPYPTLKGRPVRDWFFRDDQGDPMFVLSLHSPSRLLQRFFASPLQHIESYTVGGGSRWTIDESPVYKVFQEDPDSHRVGWDGWCGHLVRDLDSMGGTKSENTVICLENPRIRQAIEEYIRLNIPKFNKNPELLYNIMAYELMYICYCDRSQHMFREWLEAKHGTIAEANQKWGTTYASFNDVVAPPVKNAHPLPGTNRALWYDWARFNQDRFTDHLIWVRNTIRKIDPSTPLAAGGSSSMLSGHTGTSGIDEERIVNEVDDVIVHEGGGSTMGMDLQLALSETKKPLADPEMSLGSVKYLLPHLLHGKSVAQFWHWPSQPANEFYSNNHSSLAHGWMYSLADVGELLRANLDARRLNKEFAAFIDEPAEAAILYSQTSTLQLPPEMLAWNTTPYLAEMRKTYEASEFLDAKVTFVTERKIRKGWLDRYKLLLVPGVRNLQADVFAKIRAYAEAGGHVLITPESLVGDEYNRPAPYLGELGIRILETQTPQLHGSGDLVQGYDQSFSRQVTFADSAPVVLKAVGSPAETLATRGMRQKIAVGVNAETLFEYPDGSPAVVRMPVGRGAVYYSAASLERQAYSRLLDVLFEKAAVARPIRVRAASGQNQGEVECRLAELGGRRLLYIANLDDRPARLRLDGGNVKRAYELREGVRTPLDRFVVRAGTTNIYELF